MADLVTLQGWLLEAETAQHKLSTGTLEAQIQHGDMSVTYTQQKAAELAGYIVSLRAQIAAAGGANTGLSRRGLIVDLP